MHAHIKKVKDNSFKLLKLTPKQKEEIILDLARTLRENASQILQANELDLKECDKNEVIKDRLKLDKKRFESLCLSLEKIAFIQDPVGKVLDGFINHAGIKIEKLSIPIGLICVIYEARPAISAELLALLLKSSNTGILKGGSEAKRTNSAIFQALLQSLEKHGLEECFVMFSDKEEVKELLQYDDLIDLIIPRGNTQMIEQIAKNTKIPLIKHDKGLCHIFVDESANLSQAKKIIINAKCQRPSVCNALETLLVHKNIAQKLFDELMNDFKAYKLKIHTCKNSLSYFQNTELECELADDKAFSSEWLDYELSVKIVSDIDEAIAHINKFSSNHSDGILSNDASHILKFQQLINSACVYVNASTRFSDGGEFGFGAEVGISTNKLHARGPMGVNELCTYKFILTGQGQIRE